MKKQIGLFILVSIVGVFCFAFALMAYLGIFKSMTMNEVDKPAFHIVYAQHVGPYHQLNDSIIKVEKWAKENQVPCALTFGEFLDDPKKVEESRLRSNGGCLVDAPPTQLPPELQTREVPAQHYLQIEFNGSPAIGPWKIYPRAFGYLTDKGFQVPESTFEIYKIISDREMLTTYLFPARK